jgi:hypothetical protein
MLNRPKDPFETAEEKESLSEQDLSDDEQSKKVKE